MKDIRIAAVIFHSESYEPSRNIESMEKWVRSAKETGVEIICFPELNVTGYGTDGRIAVVSERIPGEITGKLAGISSDYSITILAGMAEIDRAGRIYASHLVIKPGGYTGVYRKLHIAPFETGMFTPGNEVPLFEAEGIKFGIQLCYDAHFPELSTKMALMGADVIFIPHASPRGTAAEKHRSWMRHLTARAFDNGLFVVACNQCGENSAGLQFPGTGMVISPLGEVIEKNTSGKEGMIIADLRAEDLEKVRNNKMSYFLPNRRPEVY
ncbi:MAG: nitrilase-related carbon-nitrogen hydrolase [Pseudomonadota bacterium]|nr:nitrilase [Pseudomonadota bacterium]MBU1399099.1 nitrilase [Pseudomonadota bacterium]MBU1571131.1 nitrilase [Pseudomonadota bacterium]